MIVFKYIFQVVAKLVKYYNLLVLKL